MIDIFNNDAFGVVTLSDAINDLEYLPSRIQELGMFRPSMLSTTTVSFEMVGNTLELVAPTPRGGPGETRDVRKRKMRAFTIPHFQRDWGVIADEVQNVRAMGQQEALRTVQSLVMEKIGDNMDDFTLTEEHARLGAVKGIIVYKGGETLNLFTEFGTVAPAAMNFNLPTAADGALRKSCTDVIRKARTALGGLNFGGIHAFCGDGFFDKLLSNPEFRETHLGYSEAKILRESYVGKNRGSNPIVEFGGIVFENYGEVDGEFAGGGINAEECHFFPTGVPGLFRTYYAPADYEETVNRRAKRLYAKQWPKPNGKGREGEIQSNALQLCTKPKVLQKATST